MSATSIKKAIAAKIVSQVEEYRSASNSLKIIKASTPAGDLKQQYIKTIQYRMDRAQGAIDVLYDLDPKNPLWAELKWANY